MKDAATFANPSVLAFYKTLPFNIRDSVEGSVETIRQADHANAYPPLLQVLRPGLRVLDLGCGTGWFTNSLAYHHKVEVTGVDFNPVAVERARAVAAAMNLTTTFFVDDLFLFEQPEPFDVVVSLGVLHHTNNCLAAVRRVCERLVRPGGHVLIGLYHAFGRKPLLDHFKAMKERGASEPEMLERYRQLHSQLKDETLLVSWFRDQVLHPHETQHTLKEMVPILQETGVDLLSTSINRFQPIESLPALYAEEERHYDIGVQRLKEDKYFTGFFVFFGRKSSHSAAASSVDLTDVRHFVAGARFVDAKPYIEHHALFGYQYVAGTDLQLPRPGGGRYRIRINSEGIRSDREYAFKKPKGVYRIIVCGDSMAAGQYISNALRFSELLERRIPGLEVINLSLEGSGTDQQILLYEHVGLKYQHDLVVLLPFLQNVRRNMVEWREGVDPRTGDRVLRAKPRFELVGANLVLRNVPVPATSVPAESAQTDARNSPIERLKTRMSELPGAALFKTCLYALVPWEPFPEYRDSGSPEWRLMSVIVERLRELARDKPVVLVPTFYSSYVRFHMARNYWKRFSSLAAAPGVYAIDLLPHFRAAGVDTSRCFQEPHDMHFSAYGNVVLADALEEELGKLKLLPA